MGFYDISFSSCHIERFFTDIIWLRVITTSTWFGNGAVPTEVINLISLISLICINIIGTNNWNILKNIIVLLLLFVHNFLIIVVFGHLGCVRLSLVARRACSVGLSDEERTA